ncbi:hypothetical protein B4Q13_23355 [Lacticaseibacillus rhamnosus]
MTTDPAAMRSGKGHRDENFPVASRLIHPRHRGAILAFYEFVRVADDISDHASLGADEKLELLDHLEADWESVRKPAGHRNTADISEVGGDGDDVV